jgi:hypothetical protein
MTYGVLYDLVKSTWAPPPPAGIALLIIGRKWERMHYYFSNDMKILQ